MSDQPDDKQPMDEREAARQGLKDALALSQKAAREQAAAWAKLFAPPETNVPLKEADEKFEKAREAVNKSGARVEHNFEEKATQKTRELDSLLTQRAKLHAQIKAHGAKIGVNQETPTPTETSATKPATPPKSPGS
jgi:hypothetical protein